ncbi:MAG: double zinc ribbon domain-containing protein, partial [Desulfarculales bacterium]|nr:double zinc ribbon domain-containing protein [Desulfarculales bacterium]
MLENIRQNLRLAFLRLVSPRVCLNCGTRLKDEGCFCAFCQAGIGFLPQALCRRCGAPEQICGHAAKKSGLLDGVWALAWHEGPIAAALAKFKYDGAQGHGQALGAYMAGKMEWIRQSEFDYIIPVPLHPRRLRKRGFNQAQILASYLRPEKLRVDLLVR